MISASYAMAWIFCTSQFTAADAAVTPTRVMTGRDAASRPAIITLGSTRVLVCHHSAAARGVRRGWRLAARYPGAALGALPACCTRALLFAVAGTVAAVVISAWVHVAAVAAPVTSATACVLPSVRCACAMCTTRRFVTSCSLLALFAAVASFARALQWIDGICATLSVFTAPELLACFARAQVLTTVKTDLRTKPIMTTALCSSITRAMTVARIFDDPPLRGLAEDVFLSCQQDEHNNDEGPPAQHNRSANRAAHASAPVLALVERPSETSCH